jgi:hypothetical protein
MHRDDTLGTIDPNTVVTHDDPAGRARSNYIAMADLGDHGVPGRYEQLWMRDLGEGRFELCCLPFFTYGYSLGDVIGSKTSSAGEVLGRVLQPSGHGLLRLSLHAHGPDHELVHAAIERSERPSEWRGDGYVSVDIDDTIPAVIGEVIDRLAPGGDFHWELAGSRDIARR